MKKSRKKKKQNSKNTEEALNSVTGHDSVVEKVTENFEGSGPESLTSDDEDLTEASGEFSRLINQDQVAITQVNTELLSYNYLQTY